MKIENRNDALDSINKLFGPMEQIIKSLEKDYDTDVNDWTMFLRFREKLVASQNILLCETPISFFAGIVLQNLRFDNDEEKFQFQKMINSFYRNLLHTNLETFISICKTWKFIDYRCINFQQEAKDTMSAVLDFYSKVLSAFNEVISNKK